MHCDRNQRKHKPILKRNKTSLHLVNQFIELSICDAKTLPFTFLKLLHCSLRDKYNGIFSVKLGSFKAVMASSSEAVKEVLVKKSADYAGRPQMHVFYESTLGMFKVKSTDAITPNILLRQQCWKLLRPCGKWCGNGCNSFQQCWTSSTS